MMMTSLVTKDNCGDVHDNGVSMYNGLIYAQLLIQILCTKCSYLMCS